MFLGAGDLEDIDAEAMPGIMREYVYHFLA